MATTTLNINTGDIVFMLGIVAIPLWIIFFGFVFKSLKWF